MRMTIFDYGAGNLHSLRKALDDGHSEVVLETDPSLALETDLLVLPGVGAFSQAAANLTPARAVMARRIRDGLPTIGICLGMQLLFEESDEGGGEGLGVVAGRVEQIRANRIPQIGWNEVSGDDAALAAAGFGHGYYANSFVCRPRDASVVSAWSVHENDRYPAMIRIHRTIAFQFHPEKSSRSGVRLLRQCVRELVP